MNKGTLPKVACILFVFCAAAAIASPAQVLTTLHSFDYTDGAKPTAALVQANDGNFYGTTYAGGSKNCTNGCGMVFKITPGGTLTTLYSFEGYDGDGPYAGLVQASDGNFYGTTFYGGESQNCHFSTCGTVFKITPSGALTTLYTFNGSDGANPYGGLVQASDGNFYGTTSAGGFCGGYGTVFKITPNGTLTTLAVFCSSEDPYAGLIQASDGNLYGTTTGGGGYRGGTVFKITSGGTLTTLYNFCSQTGCADGAAPEAALIQASDGNFYGTTAGGGANNDGTVFKITPSGTLTTLYSFCSQSNCADGYWPYGGLVQARDGNFYGTTFAGGAYGYNAGTVFKITPSGTLTTLDFYGYDGAWPYAGLIQARDGNFYGTTSVDGANNAGTVFRLGPPRACVVCASVK